jgi:hypothetical protein
MLRIILILSASNTMNNPRPRPRFVIGKNET